MKPHALVALLALAPGLATAREAMQEQCKALVRGPADRPMTPVDFPQLRLIGHASNAVLPPPPAGAAVIECSRDSIIPTLNDVRVLIDYRLPLAITDGERVMFLEINKGQLVLQVAQGALTPQETREAGRRLDALQLTINASNQPHGR